MLLRCARCLRIEALFSEFYGGYYFLKRVNAFSVVINSDAKSYFQTLGFPIEQRERRKRAMKEKQDGCGDGVKIKRVERQL